MWIQWSEEQEKYTSILWDRSISCRSAKRQHTSRSERQLKPRLRVEGDTTNVDSGINRLYRTVLVGGPQFHWNVYHIHHSETFGRASLALPLESSEPEAKRAGSTRLKFTDQHRFSCSYKQKWQLIIRHSLFKTFDQFITHMILPHTTQCVGIPQIHNPFVIAADKPLLLVAVPTDTA